jgi:hypothetical protein
MRSFDLGQRIHWSFRIGKRVDDRTLKLVETLLGGLPALAAALVLVWILGVTIIRLPFVGFSNSVDDSRIVRQLIDTLPPAPAVLAGLDRYISPSTQSPELTQPPHPDFTYSVSDETAAARTAAASVVRITSFSCGGLTSGSGFVVGKGLVATAAHVIAGSSRPVIKYHDRSYEGIPVYFDTTLDLGILRAPGLRAPSLALAPNNVALGTSVAVLGYPGGNYHAAPGVVRDTLAVTARSVYDQGVFGRGVYEVQTSVADGSSGGPVVLKGGQAAGMIFSKSTEASDIAYALTSANISPAVQQAATSHTRVSTGACAAD